MKFSGQLVEIISLSGDEAMRCGTLVVASAHLALALLRHGDNEACRILSDNGISAAELKRRLDEALFLPEMPPFDRRNEVVLSEGALDTIRTAALEAHLDSSSLVCPRHLLAAFLKLPGNPAGSILSSLGLTVGAIPHDHPAPSSGQTPGNAASTLPEDIASALVSELEKAVFPLEKVEYFS